MRGMLLPPVRKIPGYCCFVLACLASIGQQAAIAPDSNKSHALIAPNALNAINPRLSIPQIAGFEMTFDFDNRVRFSPIAVYQTAIQLMYDLAHKGWTENVYIAMAEEVRGTNLLIVFINPSPPTAAQQLKVMHCVAALYRSVVVMTDGLLFCPLMSQLSVRGTEIGAMSVTPSHDPPRGLGRIRSLIKNVSTTDDPVDNMVGADSGRVIDPEKPDFTIAYYFFGKAIQSKEVSMAVLEAMATAAPFDSAVECKELLAISKDGGCSIIIESVAGGKTLFTYGWAARALKVLYQEILVPQKRWGDMVLTLLYQEKRFGEMRMLRTAAARNGGDVGGVASE
ncbi:MAG: hypothetical protein Q9193_000768 [Seirophora villosa]